MDKQYAIFDMDGTLVDSMVYWKNLACEFLESKGVTHVPKDVIEKIRPMTMTESAAVFIREFALGGTPGSVSAEMNTLMDKHYCNDVLLKTGAKEYLEALCENGVRLCVASATAEHLMKICLERLGVLKYFDFLLSCETVGAGKDKPDVYIAAAKRLGAGVEEIAVYEDALYAVETAKKAGFYVIGVYDESGASLWDEITQLANESIGCF